MLKLTLIFLYFTVNTDVLSVSDNQVVIYHKKVIDPFALSEVIEEDLEGVTFDFDQDALGKDRHLLDLANTVYCESKCNPANYLGYGCYCGYGGEGVPIDDIDTCCQQHDNCYSNITYSYVQPYYWTCLNNEIICATNQGIWGNATSNGKKLCECDKAVAHCLRNYPCPSFAPKCSDPQSIQNIRKIFYSFIPLILIILSYFF